MTSFLKILSELAVAGCVSFGLTALTTLIIGSEKLRAMVMLTFVIGLIVIFAALYVADLPYAFLASMGIAGATLGAIFTALLGPVRRFIERESHH